MFNYLFPIFCFGLLITGIVFLGLLEAASQAKTEAATARARPPGSDQSKATPFHQPPTSSPPSKLQ